MTGARKLAFGDPAADGCSMGSSQCRFQMHGSMEVYRLFHFGLGDSFKKVDLT